MKKIYTLLFILGSFCFGKAIAQPSCISLGCAGNHGTITANTSGPDVNDPGLGCYGTYNYKQVYWQFFYAPTSASFTQTYHQTSTGSPINLNFIVFDMGTSAPSTFNCPINASGWIPEVCGLYDRGSADVGPGLNGENLTTAAGHFYAIAIIVWEGTDPSYAFTIGTPQLGGVDIAADNCNAFPPTCIPLGCAANYGTINANTSGPDVNDRGLGCYAPYNYKQVYWQFFYAPVSAEFTQTYHQASTGAPINLNYIVFDMGTSGEVPATCPVDASGWTQELCGLYDRGSADVGPGLNGENFTTLAGHFYAIAIIIWDNTDPSYSFTIGTPRLGGADLSFANCARITLPVRLTSFTAQASACAVDLRWRAHANNNFSYYEVQYSTDGTIFSTVTRIAADPSKQSYSYRHINPAQGKIFYRLKLIEVDDRSELSKKIGLNFTCANSYVSVYPNPVTDIVNIHITNANGDAVTGSLFDANGKLIYTGKMIGERNTINMTRFPKGIYMLTIKNNDSLIQNIKIVK